MGIKSLVAALFLAGCQTGTYFDIKEVVEPNDELVALLSKEVLVTLEKNFPPAKNKICFVHDKERLALALDEILRKNGYALITKDPRSQSGELLLAYTLDSLDERTVIVRVVVGDNFSSSRLYSKRDDGSYAPAGPLLIQNGGAP